MSKSYSTLKPLRNKRNLTISLFIFFNTKDDIMNIVIREINDDADEIDSAKTFLYGQIREVYGIGPTPKFHYDIEGLKEYYISPERNNFFLAMDGENIVATAGIRALRAFGHTIRIMISLKIPAVKRILQAFGD